MHSAISSFSKSQNEQNHHKNLSITVIKAIFLVTVNIKGVRKNYFRPYHVHLRSNKIKENVGKKEYLEEVMASTKF